MGNGYWYFYLNFIGNLLVEVSYLFMLEINRVRIIFYSESYFKEGFLRIGNKYVEL